MWKGLLMGGEGIGWAVSRVCENFGLRSAVVRSVISLSLETLDVDVVDPCYRHLAESNSEY